MMPQRLEMPAYPLFGKLTRTQLSPLHWNWVINGRDVELTKNQLFKYPQFRRKCLRYEQGCYPGFLRGVSWPEMTEEKWRQHVDNALA
jgi:hypothetical protein